MSRLRHLLPQNWKPTLIIGLIELMIIAVIPSPISANVYLGGYCTNSPCIDTTHVIMDCRIPPGVPVPSGNFLAGVLSVAGVKGGSLSGWIYQIATLRGPSNLDWDTNSWNMGSIVDAYESSLPDAGSWLAIYVRMDMGGTSSYRNRCWGYKNDTQHLTYYDEVYLDMNNGEQYFRVGTSTYSGITFKHFQFGVEGVNRITNYTWYCHEYRVGYYTDRWRYQPAKVTWQINSWITWRGSSGMKVGDSNYDGVNRGPTGSGDVIWKYTGTTVPDGTWLWSTQGLLQTFPSAPFAV